MSTSEAEEIIEEKPDRVNKILTLVIRLTILGIIFGLLPTDISTIKGITISIFTVGLALSLLDMIIPEVIQPVKESFFFVVGMKILSL